jgi:hypothetical protein
LCEGLKGASFAGSRTPPVRLPAPDAARSSSAQGYFTPLAACLIRAATALGFGDIDSVAARYLNDGGASPSRHELLREIRNHLVVADLEIPARFGLPSWLRDRAAKGLDSLGYLGVGHESSGLRIDVAGEGVREFDLVRKRVAVLGRQNRRHRRAGRRIVHRNKTDKRVCRDPVRVGLPVGKRLAKWAVQTAATLLHQGEIAWRSAKQLPPLSQMASDRRLPQRRAVEEIRRAEVGALDFDPQDALEPSQSRSSDFPAVMWSFR